MGMSFLFLAISSSFHFILILLYFILKERNRKCLDKYKCLNWELNSRLFAIISTEMRRDNWKFLSRKCSILKTWAMSLVINNKQLEYEKPLFLTILNEMNFYSSLATSRSRFQSAKYDLARNCKFHFFYLSRQVNFCQTTLNNWYNIDSTNMRNWK